MRSSTVLFALCAALVGTHALPATGHAPSSLVPLNRRSPGVYDVETNVVRQADAVTPPNSGSGRSGSGAASTSDYNLDTITSLEKIPPKAQLEAQLKAAGLDPTITSDGTKGVGDYVYLRPLGRGGFSNVLLMYKLSDSKFYALKLAINPQAYDPREYILQKKLANVASVVKVFDEFTNLSRKGFTLEVANGGDLTGLIKATKGLPDAEAMKIFVELAKGLKLLHDSPNNIAIRDIKPDNILIFKDGSKTTYKFSDFGHAYEVGVGARPTDHGDKYYLAPEGFQPASVGDYKALDVFALGCTLYEMLSKPEYQIKALLPEPKLDAKGAAFQKFAAEHDQGIVDMLKQMLVKDPAKRVPIDTVLKLAQSWVPAKTVAK